MSNKEKDFEIVVYYIGDRPDTVYEVYNKPLVGDKPYCQIAGYWLPAETGTNPPTYHFVENKNKRPMIGVDKDWLMNKIIPDSKATKTFDSLDEFILDQI